MERADDNKGERAALLQTEYRTLWADDGGHGAAKPRFEPVIILDQKTNKMNKGKRKANWKGSSEGEYEDELPPLRSPSKRRVPDKESSGFTQVSKALLKRRDGHECWVCGTNIVINWT
jgi:hypothetical protein